MSDREKMIAIFDALPKNTTFEEVADRLIEAGFVIVDKKKEKSLCPACVHNGTEGCSDWKYVQPVRSCDDYVRKE